MLSGSSIFAERTVQHVCVPLCVITFQHKKQPDGAGTTLRPESYGSHRLWNCLPCTSDTPGTVHFVGCLQWRAPCSWSWGLESHQANSISHRNIWTWKQLNCRSREVECDLWSVVHLSYSPSSSPIWVVAVKQAIWTPGKRPFLLLHRLLAFIMPIILHLFFYSVFTTLWERHKIRPLSWTLGMTELAFH